MLRKHLILALLVLLSSGLFAQGKKRLDEAIKKLKKEGVDTFVVYTKYQGGCFWTYDGTEVPCIVDGNDLYFLYWIYNGHIAAGRFDNCREYEPRYLIGSPFIAVFLAKADTFKTEEIKPYTYTPVDSNGLKSKGRVTVSSEPEAYSSLTFITAAKTTCKRLNKIVLEKNINIDDKPDNENYAYNNKLAIANLIALADTETTKLRFDEDKAKNYILANAISGLKRQGVDTIIVYNHYFIGGADEPFLPDEDDTLKHQVKDTLVAIDGFVDGWIVEPPPTKSHQYKYRCSINDYHTYFIYWVKDGKTSVTRADNCYSYEPLIDIRSGFVDGFIANAKKLKKESIKQGNSSSPHGTFTVLEGIIGKNTIYKYIAWQDVDQFPYTDSPENPNYLQNTATLQVQLANKAAAELKALVFVKRK